MLIFFNRFWLRGSLFCIALVIAHSAAGQADSTLLETVVIQATRVGTESAVPHTNLDRETISKTYHTRDIPFLLSGVPSLVETSDAGAGVGYTGMRIRGSDQSRINVTINGIPLNDAESQQVFWVNLPDLAESASEIQVQRGVGTSTNGAAAFGATVNLDLSQVEALPYTRLSNTLGSFNTRKHSISLGTGLLNNGLSFSGRLSQVRSDGYIERSRAELDAYHLTAAYVGDRQSLMFHILAGAERTQQAWYGVPAQYIDDPELRNFNPAGTEKKGEPYEDEVDDYTQRHYLLHYKRDFGKGILLQLNGHYTRGFGFFEQYRADQDLISYGFPAFSLADTLISTTDLVRLRHLDNHFFGGTFALRWNAPVNPPALRRGPEITLGGALNQYQGRHFGEVIWAELSTVPKDSRYYDNDAIKNDGNIYSQINLAFKGGLTAFVDMQYRRVQYDFLGLDQFGAELDQSVTHNFFNPKAGISWQMNDHWSSSLYYGVAHREPNRDDYTQSTPESRPLAERLQDMEAQIQYQSERFQFSSTLFYMYYHDQLVLDGRLNDVGAYIRTNLDKSYRAGVELEATARIHPLFDLQGNLALSRNKAQEFVNFLDNWDTGLQETETYTDVDLSFSPSVTSRFEGTLHAIQKEGMELDLSWIGKYVGEQYLDNTQRSGSALDAWFANDIRARAEWSLPSDRFIRLIASVNNVLDANIIPNGWIYRFRSPSFDERPFNAYTRLEQNDIYSQTGFFPQAGRNWLITLVVGL